MSDWWDEVTGEELAQELSEALDQAAKGVCLDMTTLLERRGSNRQGLAFVLFAMWAVSATREVVERVKERLAAGKYPRPMVAELHVGDLRGAAARLERRFGMPKTAGLVSAAAAALESGNEADVVHRLQNLSDYLNYVEYIIENDIPWHELAVAYEGTRVARAGLEDRMVPQFRN